MTFVFPTPSSPSSALQIVVTLGPASFSAVAALAAAGATSFRINSSHMTAAEVRAVVDRVRAIEPEAPVVIDLQGAKMRMGQLRSRGLRAGERVVLAVVPSSADELPLPHGELFAQVQPGDTLSMDDDRLRFCVESVTEARMRVRALTAGEIRSRRGVNVVEHPVELTDLGPADAALVTLLRADENLAWAVSFVGDGSELEWLRRHRPGACVVAKIERARALQHLDEIERRADATWICRGDLGAQIGAGRLARFVGRFAPRDRRCPSLMAGQVFEHLTQHPEPTRTEVCHLYDLLQRGYSGLVLSDETAVGTDPVRAVRRVAELVREFALL